MPMSEMPRLSVNPQYPAESKPATKAATKADQADVAQDQAVQSLYGQTSGPAGKHTETPVKGSASMKKKMPLILAAVAIVAGVLTGLGAQKLAAQSGLAPGIAGGPEPVSQVAGDVVNNGDVFGVQDEQTFSDSAEGYLEIGGLDGEGSHKLLRPGGAMQTVYLTSSITDLDKFDGMQVKVWGETFKGQKAGWLMDVGRVQIVNTQGTNPSVE